MGTDPQVIDFSLYFKQATLWGFLLIVLPAALIVTAFFLWHREMKKRLPEEKEKPEELSEEMPEEPPEPPENPAE
ncbi:MAG: hypothetical protein A2Y98_01895 [Candidatus Portnoybacteria bacterium RBG_19FT_COMBO_36_7]|uniref:Uncharacterized protein n=1 Tax=Candidatus Portnoybacteria bacterium RBG_19FT_COMBO_36_7 TaxID=1801992 RepID=A0A1G2F6G2_9BACT|nr:MAG: hypothetical protein A2Y98_01895 [Candidatus Portnoybacteria bacterium RBG_19FT_COMBO_36_7]